MLQAFYNDCEIFFTGGSGVVGKATIEKLLRSTDVKTIYILLRPKKGDTVEQRLDKIRSAKIFRVLKTQKRDALNKLVAIPGDISLPNLGITPFYAEKLKNVSCFFHCAATVRFNERLQDALKQNVGGTWEALKLAETLKKFKIFVHVSTFFSNPYLEYVESKMYTSPMDWKLCLQIIENNNNEELIDVLTKKLTVGFANTYCFTKNLAESLVNDYRHRLPVLVFRPSIVISALFEPEPGFPPTLMGALGIIALVGAGLTKVLYHRHDLCLDWIPQDFCTNTMLASSFIAAKKYEDGRFDRVIDVPVIMCSSYGILTFTLEKLTRIGNKYNLFYELAFDKNLFIPGYKSTDSRCLYKIMTFTHHIFPALLTDGLLVLFGQKPVLMSLARKQYSMVEVLKPFFFSNYTSDMPQMLPELLEVTKGTDFDLSCFSNEEESEEKLKNHIINIISKIREVLLNEDPSTLPRARRVFKVKIGLYYVILGCIIYYILPCLFGNWKLFINMI